MTNIAATAQPGPLRALDIARQSQSQLIVIGMVGAAGAGNSWSARARYCTMGETTMRLGSVMPRWASGVNSMGWDVMVWRAPRAGSVLRPRGRS